MLPLSLRLISVSLLFDSPEQNLGFGKMEIAQISISDIGLRTDIPSKAGLTKCGRELFDAFSKLGFVYLCDHGIDGDIVSGAFETSKDFFLLSAEEKNRIRKLAGPDQGYVERGQEIFDASQDAEKVNLCRFFGPWPRLLRL